MDMYVDKFDGYTKRRKGTFKYQLTPDARRRDDHRWSENFRPGPPDICQVVDPTPTPKKTKRGNRMVT